MIRGSENSTRLLYNPLAARVGAQGVCWWLRWPLLDALEFKVVGLNFSSQLFEEIVSCWPVRSVGTGPVASALSVSLDTAVC